MLREHLMKPHPERDGAFRWRGDGVSRIEGLSDAVFGFAVTLLVVSLEVPRTFDDLATLLLALPAFAATFTLLVLVWFAQYRFFRRYGLEDGRTIMLNVVLLFVVLFYIYPLKFLFQTFIGFFIGMAGWVIGNDWLQSAAGASQRAIQHDQWPILMCVYAGGWMALYALFAAMHRHALARADTLELDATERLITRFTIIEQQIMIGVGLASALLTLLLTYGVGIHPAISAAVGGWAYMLIWPAQTVQGRAFRRQKEALLAAARAAPAA
jgi:hypothetical protein